VTAALIASARDTFLGSSWPNPTVARAITKQRTAGAVLMPAISAEFGESLGAHFSLDIRFD
jgi:hypothetical protein